MYFIRDHISNLVFCVKGGHVIHGDSLDTLYTHKKSMELHKCVRLLAILSISF